MTLFILNIVAFAAMFGLGFALGIRYASRKPAAAQQLAGKMDVALTVGEKVFVDTEQAAKDAVHAAVAHAPTLEPAK